MEDLRRLRNPSNAATSNMGKAAVYGQYHSGAPISKPQHGHMYLPTVDNSNMAALAQGFGGMGLQGNGIPPQGYIVNGGQFIWPTSMPTTQSGLTHSPGIFNPISQQFMNPAYAHYSQQNIDHSPHTHTWASSRATSSEVPTLITPRRGSSSSNEIDLPGTPYTHNGYNDFHGGVAVVDHSPNSLNYAWSTPSPPQHPFGSSKAQAPNVISPVLQSLLIREPAIPRAVPAPYSPPKPLDRSLENPKGVTNVYIRGLLPSTSDELLYSLAKRFGDIVSSKSIIDLNTGRCKGYGFVKFHNFKDAENCIRGFHHLGYETSFARESFYSQLKKLSDDLNNNLYVSNLPNDMNEHELGAVFGQFKVCSSRILRDGAGHGRGVGFARFESRDVCEDVIKHYNNTPVAKPGGEEHLIQIRYADTQDQKALKQQTAAARQYRSAEYESQTQSPAGKQMYSDDGINGFVNGSPVPETDFETYMATTTGTNNGKQDQQADPRVHARDRLTAVTSHLSPKSNTAYVKTSVPPAVVAEPGTETKNGVNSSTTSVSSSLG